MRKVRPDDVKDSFQSDVQELTNYLNRTRRAIEADSAMKADVSRLMSTTFLTMYVAFERFLSDLFLSYLNRDFSQYQKDLAVRIDQSIGERFGSFAQARSEFDPIKHVALHSLEDVVDSSGRNLAFQNANAIKTKARQWLSPAHSRKFQALSPHDERLIDTARAIRDFIAHESPAAKATMNEALANVTDGIYNQYLGRGPNQVRNVGAYLKAVFDGRRRIATYAKRLIEVSQKM